MGETFNSVVELNINVIKLVWRHQGNDIVRVAAIAGLPYAIK